MIRATGALTRAERDQLYTHATSAALGQYVDDVADALERRVTGQPIPANLAAAVVRGRADDPCAAYLNIPGPHDTMHTVACSEPYGHDVADYPDLPMHLGTIQAHDRYDQPVTATVAWYGR